jgi:uncharacterized protein YuzE
MAMNLMDSLADLMTDEQQENFVHNIFYFRSFQSVSRKMKRYQRRTKKTTRMKITYDPKADALYFKLRDASCARTDRYTDDLIVDFGSDGQITGIELLSASHHSDADAIIGSVIKHIDDAS